MGIGRFAALSSSLVLIATTGCRGGAGIHIAQSEGRPPSNVTALCQIDGAKGPLEGLKKEEFHVFEDGIEITGDAGPVIANIEGY